MPERRPFQDSLPELRDGDIALFRGAGWISWLITIGGRSHYSHAALVALWFGVPMLLEFREGIGGRAVTLASQVRRYPGQIDFYRVAAADEETGQYAVQWLIRMVGEPYSWLGILTAAALHLPVLRWFRRPDMRDNDNGHVRWRPMFCSQAVAGAWQHAGHDLVPRLADSYAEPGDIGRSAALTEIGYA
jgi:hypothetical protein